MAERNAINRRYRSKNRDKVRAWARAAYGRDLEASREKNRRRYRLDPVAARLRARRWRERNRTAIATAKEVRKERALPPPGGAPVNVYRAVNLLNGNIYIGITKFDLRTRTRQHAVAARTGKQFPFMSAIRKYGIEMFRFSLVRTCHDRRLASEEEKRLIAAWGPEYNATIGGDGGSYWLGKKRAPETIAKIAMKRRANRLGVSIGH